MTSSLPFEVFRRERARVERWWDCWDKIWQRASCSVDHVSFRTRSSANQSQARRQKALKDARLLLGSLGHLYFALHFALLPWQRCCFHHWFWRWTTWWRQHDVIWCWGHIRKKIKCIFRRELRLIKIKISEEVGCRIMRIMMRLGAIRSREGLKKCLWVDCVFICEAGKEILSENRMLILRKIRRWRSEDEMMKINSLNWLLTELDQQQLHLSSNLQGTKSFLVFLAAQKSNLNSWWSSSILNHLTSSNSSILAFFAFGSASSDASSCRSSLFIISKRSSKEAGTSASSLKDLCNCDVISSSKGDGVFSNMLSRSSSGEDVRLEVERCWS